MLIKCMGLVQLEIMKNTTVVTQNTHLRLQMLTFRLQWSEEQLQLVTQMQ